MKFIKQFIIIIAFTFIGELLHFLIPLIRKNEKHRFGKTKCDYFV